MKGVILLCFCLVLGFGEIQQAKAYSKKCIEEIDIDPEVVAKLRNGDYSVKDEKSKVRKFSI